MITENSNNSRFKVTFQGNAGAGVNWEAFTSSNSLIRVERLDVQQLSLVTILCQPNPNRLETYYTDPNGVVELPMRNFVSQNAGLVSPQMGMDIAMTELDGTSVDTFGKIIDIKEGVSFFDMLAPRRKDAPQLYWEGEHNVILPPNVILNPDRFAGAAGLGVIVESNYHTIDADAEWSVGNAGLFVPVIPDGRRSSQLRIPYAASTLRIAAGKDLDQVKEWTLSKADECTDMVVCRWTSQTGAVRQHFFPILAFLTGVDGTFSLVEAGNGYDVRKNTFTGVRCRLTGLTAYGFWYYMDMLRASDLHAIVQPTYSSFEDEIASMETAAYCETDTAETPQGSGFFNLDFTLKLRHYDTH